MKRHKGLKVQNPQEPDQELSKYFYVLFQTILNDEGHYVGEDITFCRRWRSMGGKIWADPAGSIAHVGEQIHQGALSSLFKVEQEESCPTS